MENFYIPPIILNKKTPTDKTKPAVHVCVDGKQRLSSVRAFVKGLIPCHDFRSEKWSVPVLMLPILADHTRWFCDTPTSRRKKVLPEETQRMFLAKEFVSFEFKDLQPDQEEDLFARVQMGVQLSLAEKMRASTGPWQELARLFVDDFPVIYTLMKDRARAKDFQLTLSCFSQIVEVMHPTASDGIPILKTNYNALPKLLSNKGAVDDGLKSHLASVWNTFKDLVEDDPHTFTNANKYLRGVQTFAPVEMVAVTVLISMYSNTRNKRLLLSDIKAMREAIREEFADIRTNSTVWKFIWKWVENLEGIRGAVDGSTVDRRPPTTATAAIPALQSPAMSTPTTVTKRARPTAKTETPIIPPPRQSATVKKEEIVQTPSVVPRQSKRQRTGDGPIGLPTSVLEHSPTSTANNHAPGLQMDPLAAQLAQYVYTQPQNPTMPTHVSASPTVRVQEQAPCLKSVSAHERAALLPWSSGSGSNQPSAPSFDTAPPTSDSSTAQRPLMFTYASPDASFIEPGHNDYKVPTAPMASAALDTSPYMTPREALTNHMVSTPGSSTTSSEARMNGSHRSYTPNKTNTNLKTGLGAYSPKHTEQQWAGEVRSATPPRELASSSSTTRRTGQKPRKAPPRPPIAQYDGVIDLTSDTEQERQDLLSSFKAKALVEKPQRNASSPATSSSSYMFNQRKGV